jgi:alkanesulfonate monooxygenase SsuD/methylene tetrahydromethanopterin reductase-like flavin-dependent oxidoreductase (luciferase family)
VRNYQRDFRPANSADTPRALVCTAAICAETEEAADRIALSMDLRRIHMATGVESVIPSVDEALAYPWSERERAYAAQQRPRAIVGSPTQVRDGIEALAHRYGVDEVMLLTITGDYYSRRRSYELIAHAFELTTAAKNA